MFAPGERVYLLLRRHEGRRQVPTPTFGRYPLRDGAVHVATLRDTYLRLTLTQADFEAVIGLHLGRPDAAWLAELRHVLANSAPTQTDGALRARQYVALEALALVGKADDQRALEAFLVPEAPFQMRVSACRALARAGGVAAIDRLLRVARDDPEPAVRTTAIRALASLEQTPADLVPRLAALVPRASSEPVRFSGPNDPRTNRWPSPRIALISAIGSLGAAPARDALLAQLDAEGVELEVYSATLRALLTSSDDRALSGELVRRLRGEGPPGADLYDRELCAALTQLTGEPFGPDVARWRAWLAARSR